MRSHLSYLVKKQWVGSSAHDMLDEIAHKGRKRKGERPHSLRLLERDQLHSSSLHSSTEKSLFPTAKVSSSFCVKPLKVNTFPTLQIKHNIFFSTVAVMRRF